MEDKIERLQEIIKIAEKLKWVYPKTLGYSYPLMQLSEVEKCMLAMTDDLQLERLRRWEHDFNMQEKVRKHQEQMTKDVIP
jgi:hypothetical protein